MTILECTARRIGDYESRTEEYQLTYAVEGGNFHTIQVKYQAARAFEINQALDKGVEAARAAISEVAENLMQRPTDEALSQLTWKTLQSVKYEEGAPQTTCLEL